MVVGFGVVVVVVISTVVVGRVQLIPVETHLSAFPTVIIKFKMNLSEN